MLHEYPDNPDLCREGRDLVLRGHTCVFFHLSLRSMHERKQPPLLAPLISAWQWAVTSTPLGRAVVAAVLHQPAILRAILAR